MKREFDALHKVAPKIADQIEKWGIGKIVIAKGLYPDLSDKQALNKLNYKLSQTDFSIEDAAEIAKVLKKMGSELVTSMITVEKELAVSIERKRKVQMYIDYLAQNEEVQRIIDEKVKSENS